MNMCVHIVMRHTMFLVEHLKCCLLIKAKEDSIIVHEQDFAESTIIVYQTRGSSTLGPKKPSSSRSCHKYKYSSKIIISLF